MRPTEYIEHEGTTEGDRFRWEILKRLEEEGYVLIKETDLRSFIDDHIHTIDGEWGSCRKKGDFSLRMEYKELFNQFDLAVISFFHREEGSDGD